VGRLCGPGPPRGPPTPAGAVGAGGAAGAGKWRDRAQYAGSVTPEQLSDVVRSALAAAVERGVLAVDVPAEVVIDRPKNPEHGDYATNVAMLLTKRIGVPPRAIAEKLVAARAPIEELYLCATRGRP
jgi:hypothetical protein